MKIAARITFVLLMLLQAALVVCLPIHREPLNADEHYHIDRARFVAEHGSFPRASAEELRIEHGAWGTSDWRPQGYALFVLLCSGGNFDESSLVPRVVLVQLALMLACTTLAFLVLARLLTPRASLLAALVLGIAPWPFTYVQIISPDSVSASLVFAGMILLARAIERRGAAAWAFAAASLVVSLTLHMRPEMALLAPLTIGVALLLRMRTGLPWRSATAAAAATFLVIASLHYAYRLHFTGERMPGFFGGLHIVDGGPFHWTNTWIGTEHEAYDFVYGLTNGQLVPLPARAFGDAEERRAIEDAVARVRRSGYTQDVDATFERIAKKRTAEHPFSALLLPRVWHAAHLWLNSETNAQLLNTLKPLDRNVRRVLLGFLLLLKLVLLVLFPFAFVRAIRRRDPLMILLGAFVVGRTLLVGLVLGWMVHRYMVMAWLPLLVCSLAFAGDLRGIVRHSRKLPNGTPA